MKNIFIQNLTYHYDHRKTDGISKLNVKIETEKITALIGPSGSGKTTMLKCISGHLKYSEGNIEIPKNESIVYLDQQIKVDEHTKTVYEFLDNELFFSIQDSEKRSNIIRSALSELQITNEINSSMDQLSGGQKQRVFIARALIHNPTILLLDEPFANLDRYLRRQLIQELFEILSEKKITLIWVTHSIEEAFGHSDQIILLNYGKIQQFGTPQNLYYQPQNLFVADFLSNGNIIVEKILSMDEDFLKINLFGIQKVVTYQKENTFQNYANSSQLSQNSYALFFIPSEAVIIQNNSGEYDGVIEETHFLGPSSLHSIKIKDKILQSTSSSTLELITSNKIQFSIDQKYIYCIGKA